MTSEGFSVDHGALGRLAQRLVDLRGELDRGAGAVEPLLGAVGHDELRARLHEFAGNWSDTRLRIAGQLDSVAGLAAAAADRYRTTDVCLRDGFPAPPAPVPAAEPSGGR
jgi:hypothetical protein